MARLQDFQSVTPTGSDNLLIVQSQGQGLSTLNAVGQKVATETTMSNLNTTSKNLVGAVNEVNNKKASDIEYSSGVTVKQQLDKAILYNQNGIFITKVGHSYLASFSSAKISDVYTDLDDYNPSGVFLNAVWNSDTAKANVVRINSGKVTVLDTNPWSAIASTDTTKIQGSLAWND